MANPPPMARLFDLRSHFSNKFTFKSRQPWFPIWCHEDFKTLRNGVIQRTYGAETFKANQINLTTVVDGFQGVFSPRPDEIDLGERELILNDMKTFTEWRPSEIYINDSKIFIRQVMENGKYLSRTYANRDIQQNAFVCHVGGRLVRVEVEGLVERLRNSENDLLAIPLDYSILTNFFFWSHVKDEKLRKVERCKDPGKTHIIETFVMQRNNPVVLSPSSFVKYARTEEEANVVLDYLTNYRAAMNVDQKKLFFLRSLRPIQKEEEILLSPAKIHRGTQDEEDEEIEQQQQFPDQQELRFPSPQQPAAPRQIKKTRSKPRRPMEVTLLETIENSPMVLRSGRSKRSREDPGKAVPFAGPSTSSTSAPLPQDTATTTPSSKGPSPPSSKGPSPHSSKGPSTPSSKGPSPPSSKGPSTPSSKGPSTPSSKGPSTASKGPSTPSSRRAPDDVGEQEEGIEDYLSIVLSPDEKRARVGTPTKGVDLPNRPFLDPSSSAGNRPKPIFTSTPIHSPRHQQGPGIEVVPESSPRAETGQQAAVEPDAPPPLLSDQIRWNIFSPGPPPIRSPYRALAGQSPYQLQHKLLSPPMTMNRSAIQKILESEEEKQRRTDKDDELDRFTEQIHGEYFVPEQVVDPKTHKGYTIINKPERKKSEEVSSTGSESSPILNDNNMFGRELPPAIYPYSRISESPETSSPESPIERWVKSKKAAAINPKKQNVSVEKGKIIRRLFDHGIEALRDIHVEEEAWRKVLHKDKKDPARATTPLLPQINRRNVPAQNRITPFFFPPFLQRIPVSHNSYIEENIRVLRRQEDMVRLFLMFRETRIVLENENIFLTVTCGLRDSRNFEKFLSVGLVIVDTKMNVSSKSLHSLMLEQKIPPRTADLLEQTCTRERELRSRTQSFNLRREFEVLEKYLIEMHGCKKVFVLQNPTQNEVEDFLCDLRHVTDKLVHFCGANGMFLPIIAHFSVYAEWEVLFKNGKVPVNFMNILNFHTGDQETSPQSIYPLVLWAGHTGTAAPPKKNVPYPDVFVLSPTPRNSRATPKQIMMNLKEFSSVVAEEGKLRSKGDTKCDLLEAGAKLLHSCRFTRAKTKLVDDQSPKPTISSSCGISDFFVRVDPEGNIFGKVNNSTSDSLALHVMGTHDPDFIVDFGGIMAETQKLLNVLKSNAVSDDVLIRDEQDLEAQFDQALEILKEKKAKTFIFIASSGDGSDHSVKLGDPAFKARRNGEQDEVDKTFVLEYGKMLDKIAKNLPALKRVILIQNHGAGQSQTRAVHRYTSEVHVSIGTADARKSIISLTQLGSFGPYFPDCLCPFTKVAAVLLQEKNFLAFRGIPVEEVFLLQTMITNVMNNLGTQHHEEVYYDESTSRYQCRTTDDEYTSTPFASTSINFLITEREKKAELSPFRKTEDRPVTAPANVPSPNIPMEPGYNPKEWEDARSQVLDLGKRINFRPGRGKVAGLKIVVPEDVSKVVLEIMDQFFMVNIRTIAINEPVSVLRLKQLQNPNMNVPKEIVELYLHQIAWRNNQEPTMIKIAVFSVSTSSRDIETLRTDVTDEFIRSHLAQLNLIEDSNALAFFPIYEADEWSLVTFQGREFHYYTSNPAKTIPDGIRDWILKFLNAGFKYIYETTGKYRMKLDALCFEPPSRAFRETKPADGGIYVCQVAEQLARGESENVLLRNIEAYRLVMAIEIIADRLLPR